MVNEPLTAVPAAGTRRRSRTAHCTDIIPMTPRMTRLGGPFAVHPFPTAPLFPPASPHLQTARTPAMSPMGAARRAAVPISNARRAPDATHPARTACARPNPARARGARSRTKRTRVPQESSRIRPTERSRGAEQRPAKARPGLRARPAPAAAAAHIRRTRARVLSTGPATVSARTRLARFDAGLGNLYICAMKGRAW